MSDELAALDPIPETVTLVSGTQVVLLDLRTKQFFKFLRIITHGALPIMRDPAMLRLDADTDPEAFTGRLLSLLMLAIPDADEEALDFVRSMCAPAGLIEGRRLNKQDTERNTALWDQLDLELANPELDDLITIIEAIVRRESADIQALGKRLLAMFSLARKTGQLNPAQPSPNPTSPAPSSSADSPAPTTLSPPNTDGLTSASVTYASGGYANA